MSYEGSGLADFPAEEARGASGVFNIRKSPGVRTRPRTRYSLKGSLRLAELIYRRYVAPRQAALSTRFGPSFTVN